jgi:sugar lactone lactonase YvrE
LPETKAGTKVPQWEEPVMRRVLAAAALVPLLSLTLADSAAAWERGKVDIFATLPDGATGPEGLTVGRDGNVYVTTFGFNSKGPVAGPGQLYVFRPDGRLLRNVAVQGSTSHLLGLAFQPSTRALLVIDFGGAKVLKVNPADGSASSFITLPPDQSATAGLNALTFDRKGNIYVSDSFQGIIWTTGPNGGVATPWASDDPSNPAPVLTTKGVPPFGANGIEFNASGTTLYVANTGNDTIVQIPVNGDGTPGTASVLVNSINGADGIVLDGRGNIWAAANQADEIVVIDDSGKAIAKLGDFDGVGEGGVPHGLLFPASPAFSPDGELLYVSNLALDLRLAVNAQTQAVDSQWTAEVTRYTISKLRARIPPLPDGRGD